SRPSSAPTGCPGLAAVPPNSLSSSASMGSRGNHAPEQESGAPSGVSDPRAGQPHPEGIEVVAIAFPLVIRGASGETRTPTASRPPDPKSGASASSATLAHEQRKRGEDGGDAPDQRRRKEWSRCGASSSSGPRRTTKRS